MYVINIVNEFKLNAIQSLKFQMVSFVFKLPKS